MSLEKLIASIFYILIVTGCGGKSLISSSLCNEENAVTVADEFFFNSKSEIKDEYKREVTENDSLFNIRYFLKGYKVGGGGIIEVRKSSCTIKRALLSQ